MEHITQTLTGLLTVYNDPNTASSSQEKRIQAASRFYVPAEAYASDDQPLYFGPTSDPISIGPNAFLANVNMNYDQYRDSGLLYNIQLTETQIRVDQAMAMVAARTVGILRQKADGKVVYTTPGRWTIMLEKHDGRWLISHEHVSFFNESRR
jgi:hypothetical protein